MSHARPLPSSILSDTDRVDIVRRSVEECARAHPYGWDSMSLGMAVSTSVESTVLDRIRPAVGNTVGAEYMVLTPAALEKVSSLEMMICTLQMAISICEVDAESAAACAKLRSMLHMAEAAQIRRQRQP